MGSKSHHHKQKQKQGPAKSWNGPVAVALAQLGFAGRSGDAQLVAAALIAQGKLAADGPFSDDIPISDLIHAAWTLGLENKPYGLQQQYGRLLHDHPQSSPAIEHIASLAEGLLDDSVIDQLAQAAVNMAVDERFAGHGYDLSEYETVADFLDQSTDWWTERFPAPTVGDPIEELALRMIDEALISAAEKAIANAPAKLKDFFQLAAGNQEAYDEFALFKGYGALSRNDCSQPELMGPVAAMDFRETLARLRPDALDRLKRDTARRDEIDPLGLDPDDNYSI